MMRPRYAAFWVPAFESDPDHYERLAVGYADGCRKEFGGRGCLLTYTKNQLHGPLASFAERTRHASARSHANAEPPVLAAYPDTKLLEIAGKIGNGSAVIAIETPATPLRGWAMEVGAYDAVSEDITQDTRPPTVKKLLDQLDHYGNNGWGTNFDKQVVPNVIADLRSEGADDTIIIGSMLGRGASADSIKTLRDRYLNRRTM